MLTLRKLKMLRFCVLFMVANVAFISLFFSCSSIYDETSIISGDIVTAATSIRGLAEGSNTPRKMKEGNINLEDYHRIDPVPSSRASSITSGTIEHSSPLMPYIPKLSPPDSSQRDGSPLSPPPPSPA